MLNPRAAAVTCIGSVTQFQENAKAFKPLDQAKARNSAGLANRAMADT
jgi:hypothetical protein